MGIVLGKKTSRIVPIVANEVGDGDKVVAHKLEVEIEIIPREEWEAMNKRWNKLGDLLKQRDLAFRLGKELPFMSDEDIEDANQRIYKVAEPYIKDIKGFTNEDGSPAVFCPELRAAALSIEWIRDPIEEAFGAVQRGITVAKYRENRAKNL